MAEFMDTSIRHEQLSNQNSLLLHPFLNQTSIYHYTSSTGFKGILESGKLLWFRTSIS